MTWTEQIVSALERLEVELVTYLPDTPLGPLFDELEAHEDIEAVLVNREESAVAIACGAWLGGTRAALCCQSSGLANTFNAIASLSLPARIPFLALVTRRGDLGEFNLAQVPAGYNLPGVLDEMGVRNHVVDDPDLTDERVFLAGQTAFWTETPYVVMFDSTVVGYKEEQ